MVLPFRYVCFADLTKIFDGLYPQADTTTYEAKFNHARLGPAWPPPGIFCDYFLKTRAELEIFILIFLKNIDAWPAWPKGIKMGKS